MVKRGILTDFCKSARHSQTAGLFAPEKRRARILACGNCLKKGAPEF